MCVSPCVSPSVCPCVSILWKPEVEVACLPQSLYLIFEAVSFTKPGAHWLNRLIFKLWVLSCLQPPSLGMSLWMVLTRLIEVVRPAHCGGFISWVAVFQVCTMEKSNWEQALTILCFMTVDVMMWPQDILRTLLPQWTSDCEPWETLWASDFFFYQSFVTVSGKETKAQSVLQAKGREFQTKAKPQS